MGARILEWVAIYSFRVSFQPRDRTHVLVNMKSYLLVVLIYIFLVADYIDYLFMCLLVISITSSDKKEYSDDFPILKIRIFFL